MVKTVILLTLTMCFLLSLTEAVPVLETAPDAVDQVQNSPAEDARVKLVVRNKRSAAPPNCSKCGVPGHIGRECTEAQKKACRDSAPPNCQVCGQTGHISRNCSDAQKFYCRNCGQPGHISRDCAGL